MGIPTTQVIDLVIILGTKAFELLAKVQSGQEITEKDLEMETLDQTIDRIKKESLL